MDEKKLVPAIRFRGFTDAWGQCLFGDLYRVNVERNNVELLPYSKCISIASMSYNPSGNGASLSSISTYVLLRIGDIAFEGHTNKEFRYGRFVLNDLGNGLISTVFKSLRPRGKTPLDFWSYYIHSEYVMRPILRRTSKAGIMMNQLVSQDFLKEAIHLPNDEKECNAIGLLMRKIDRTVALRQRKHDEKVFYPTTFTSPLNPGHRPHDEIEVLVFQLLDDVQIDFLRRRHAGMAKPAGDAPYRNSSEKKKRGMGVP